MQIKIIKNPNGYDHDIVKFLDDNNNPLRGHGIIGHRPKAMICLIRCPSCIAENWAPAVSSGCCAWCGFDVKSLTNIKVAQVCDG